jgi:hypothetical protein
MLRMLLPRWLRRRALLLPLLPRAPALLLYYRYAHADGVLQCGVVDGRGGGPHLVERLRVLDTVGNKTWPLDRKDRVYRLSLDRY